MPKQYDYAFLQWKLVSPFPIPKPYFSSQPLTGRAHIVSSGYNLYMWDAGTPYWLRGARQPLDSLLYTAYKCSFSLYRCVGISVSYRLSHAELQVGEFRILPPSCRWIGPHAQHLWRSEQVLVSYLYFHAGVGPDRSCSMTALLILMHSVLC